MALYRSCIFWGITGNNFFCSKNNVLQVWAIFIVYTTWSIRTFIVESRWILIAMYNVLLFLALLATLLATLKSSRDQTLFHLVVPFIELSTTTIVVAVYAPSVLKGENSDGFLLI
jgi:hypothetical protein